MYRNDGWLILMNYNLERCMKQVDENGKPMRNLVSFIVAQEHY